MSSTSQPTQGGGPPDPLEGGAKDAPVRVEDESPPLGPIPGHGAEDGKRGGGGANHNPRPNNRIIHREQWDRVAEIIYSRRSGIGTEDTGHR